jgi:hypothetical protein
MPKDRLDCLCRNIEGSLDHITRQLRHLLWLMLVMLTLTLILFVKVFDL